MLTLSDAKTRLKTQLLDPFELILPETSLEEALRRALEDINAYLATSDTLQGLDGQATGSLPNACYPALFYGAAGQCLHFVLMHQSISSQNLPLPPEHLEAWAEQLQLIFRNQLEGLHRQSLQNADALPWFRWQWKEDEGAQ